jgi:N-acetylglucosamine malate deacetylase 2
LDERVAVPSTAGKIGCATLLRLLEPVITCRVLLIVAHPDDESIGAGSVLLRSVDAHVVVVTEGAPDKVELWPDDVRGASRDEYATLRRNELQRALSVPAVAPDRIHLIGVRDAEVSRSVADTARALARLLDELAPDIVLTHAYEGGHVDHDATAFAVHAAMALRKRGHAHEFALYHGRGDTTVVHEFLPAGQPSVTFHLDDASRRRKSRMLEHYRSQGRYRTYFATDIERYRCAPSYEFTRAPAAGQPLLYERFSPGQFQQWQHDVCAALDELNLDEHLREGEAELLAPPDMTSLPVANGLVESRVEYLLVSVILRTVGRATLTDALRSIERQTYPNIEIVLVDAGGKGVPAAWTTRDQDGPALKVCHAAGADRPVAANIGIQAAAGTYLSCSSTTMTGFTPNMWRGSSRL